MYPQPFHLAASLSCHWDQPALPRLPFHEQVKSVSMRSCVAYHYSALIAYWGGRAEGVVLYMCLLSGWRQQLYNIPPEAINPAHWTFASSSKKRPPRLTLYFKTLIIPEYVPLNLTHIHTYIYLLDINMTIFHCCFSYLSCKDIVYALLLIALTVWHPFHSWGGHANGGDEVHRREMDRTPRCWNYASYILGRVVHKTFPAEQIFRDVSKASAKGSEQTQTNVFAWILIVFPSLVLWLSGWRAVCHSEPVYALIKRQIAVVLGDLSRSSALHLH